MTFRITPLAGALALALSACPPAESTPDAGRDAGGNPQTGDCTVECGPLQKCHAERHVCVDLCDDACPTEYVCVTDNGQNPRCELVPIECGGQTCAPGQNACIDGKCSCTPAQVTGRDSCAPLGKICREAWNPVTQQGGSCSNPKAYEYCNPGCTGSDCGSCQADAGQVCTPGVLLQTGMCLRDCSQLECAEDELCFRISNTTQEVRCLPSGASSFFDCFLLGTLPDAGFGLVRAEIGDRCYKMGAEDGGPSEVDPSGTCTWSFVSDERQKYPIDYCRTAGTIPEFGTCKTEQMPFDVANTCGTGLECVATGRAGDGICLPICTTELLSGATAEGCETGESCVNHHRYAGTRELVGACMDECDVFSTAANYGCLDYGARVTSCVPVPGSGVYRASPDGKGICLPQLLDPKAEGQACAESDSFKGAACQSGLICTSPSGQGQPTCVKPCDLGCVPGDGGVPARCATEANATCSAGRTCQVATGAPGATMGFCL